ncbi:MAG: calcium-binding protein [Bacteroidota bacterium]
MKFKTGDIVKIKKGVTIEDINIPIAGWHGRVGVGESEYMSSDLVMIELDSVVLKSLPKEYILETLRQTDIDSFNHLYMEEGDLEIANARDTEEEVEEALEFINENYFWLATGDGDLEHEIIQEVTLRAEEEEEDELGAWWDYLEENLKFPFKAEVAEHGGGSPVGTVFKIQKLHDEDDHSGIIVRGKENRFRGKNIYYPLCDLEAVDEKSPNYLHLRAYVVWFANR